MVDKVKKILTILRTDNKPVWLFALLKMDEFIDKWTLIISAPWVTKDNRENIFQHIIDLLKENLNQDELSSIARIGLIDKDEHLAQELLKRKTGDILKEDKINGNTVHEGEILESNIDLVWPSADLFTTPVLK